ncbi:nucleolar gtp-binding protein [Cyanidiococcus yangmingshanensis]|uniref:Nucleolar GTP-binding protein 2 n=1 Tax=Cyanidiococcus yangmingshanensis TaxID=2690220 RepID=A0A7J7IQY3_9RHOD|nr:nucleolar gtp-binding protein [Cyanidiococcus yangmingshanensis]
MPKQKVKLTQGAQGRLPRSSTDPNRGNVQLAGSGWGRTRSTVKRLRMYARPAYERDRRGRVRRDKGDLTSSIVKEVGAGRIAPNRRWFGNTRTVDQESLRSFRDGIASAERDPYTFVLRQRHLPWALIKQGMEDRDVKRFEQALGVGRPSLRAPTSSQSHSGRGPYTAQRALLQLEPFSETFHQRRWRKRPRLAFDSFEELAERACGSAPSESMPETSPEAAADLDHSFKGPASTTSVAPGSENHSISAIDSRHEAAQQHGRGDLALNGKHVYTKGQSQRIWSELYKVIDASDVVLFVLDARDPLGTRIPMVESMLRREHPHKHLAFILNKCDLIPKWATGAWLRHLSREYPTVAFRANDWKRSFGRGALIQLLRQFARLHRKDRQSISCGIVGYPNVGKSSVINALRREKVVRAAPVPGETKVWQYVTLFRRVYLVDCPGVVHARLAEHMDTSDMVLRGVIRVESLRDDAERHIARLMERVERRHLEAIYAVTWGGDHQDAFLDELARARGKLLPGGEPDRNAVAKLVIHDFIRGRLPWFVPPPNVSSGVCMPVPAANANIDAVNSKISSGTLPLRHPEEARDQLDSAIGMPWSGAEDDCSNRELVQLEHARPLVEDADALLQALSEDTDDEYDDENDWSSTSDQGGFLLNPATTRAAKTQDQRPSCMSSSRHATGEATLPVLDHDPSTRCASKRRPSRMTKRARRIAEWSAEPGLQANLQRLLSRTQTGP